MKRDEELLERARFYCDRGDPLPVPPKTDMSGIRPRLRKIVASRDQHLACYLVPQLLELIERRGLRPENEE